MSFEKLEQYREMVREHDERVDGETSNKAIEFLALEEMAQRIEREETSLTEVLEEEYRK